MTRPTLEDLTAGVDETCAAILGDTIQYAADGATFSPLKAYVNYRDAEKQFEGAEAVAQDITVSGLLKSTVPVKPGAGVRLTLPRIAGKTWKPINARTDESGTGWEFEVKEVPGA
jgi:hypothetical protein